MSNGWFQPNSKIGSFGSFLQTRICNSKYMMAFLFVYLIRIQHYNCQTIQWHLLFPSAFSWSYIKMRTLTFCQLALAFSKSLNSPAALTVFIPRLNNGSGSGCIYRIMNGCSSRFGVLTHKNSQQPTVTSRPSSNKYGKRTHTCNHSHTPLKVMITVCLFVFAGFMFVSFSNYCCDDRNCM